MTRLEVWVRFAAAASTSRDVRSAASIADALLVEYDKRAGTEEAAHTGLREPGRPNEELEPPK